MKNAVLKYTLKALCLTFIMSIVATGALAVHLTHVQASVTLTFGEKPLTGVPMMSESAIAADLETLALPIHRKGR